MYIQILIILVQKRNFALLYNINKNKEKKVYNMLDNLTKEEQKIIINSYINDTKEFACSNQHYIEACGLYCPATGTWSLDMGGKLNPRCTIECPNYVQSGTQKRAEKMVALFNQIKIDTVEKIIKYIEQNPTCNNGDLIIMLMEEKEKIYVEEVCKY